MHTDTEFITIMQVDSSGLEILDRRDFTKWHAIPPPGNSSPVPDGAFVVIFGDAFEAFTNDKVRATCHRVRLPRKEDGPRASIIQFVALDELVEPPPAFGRERARSSRQLEEWWERAREVSGALL